MFDKSFMEEVSRLKSFRNSLPDELEAKYLPVVGVSEYIILFFSVNFSIPLLVV